MVDHTWRYVNKDGSPDRRFKHNRELPIAAYDALSLSSISGLNELVYCSKAGSASSLALAFTSLATAKLDSRQ